MKGRFMVLTGIIIFALVGFAMLYGAWHFTKDTRSFLTKCLPTTGTILELIPETNKTGDNEVDTSYYAMIKYKVSNNDSLIFKSNCAVDQYEYPVGEEIKILYDKNNIKDARIDSFNSKWGSSIYLLIFGLVFIAASILIFFFAYIEVQIDTMKVVATAFTLTSVLFLFLAYHLSKESTYLKANGLKTSGIIISDHGSPLVEYTAENGKKYKHQSKVSSSNSNLQKGDPVEILYDAKKPSRSRINSFNDLWFTTSLSGGFGGLFLIVSIILIILIFIRH